ncbi:hypothetical protein BSU04_18615 [Caballeronia sordidicola]|uniref:Uncharacterized protein n=1 Tax=Caballeronia sordidicola TaxID=196367 RepID=A0A226X0R3_CABSO|nr:hypothetical protein BSU04_18615 [Caballeronia sordidicola]
MRRLASVSNGAFLIARAGLADHRAVTTHWRAKSDAIQE